MSFVSCHARCVHHMCRQPSRPLLTPPDPRGTHVAGADDTKFKQLICLYESIQRARARAWHARARWPRLMCCLRFGSVHTVYCTTCNALLPPSLPLLLSLCLSRVHHVYARMPTPSIPSPYPPYALHLSSRDLASLPFWPLESHVCVCTHARVMTNSLVS